MTEENTHHIIVDEKTSKQIFHELYFLKRGGEPEDLWNRMMEIVRKYVNNPAESDEPVENILKLHLFKGPEWLLKSYPAVFLSWILMTKGPPETTENTALTLTIPLSLKLETREGETRRILIFPKELNRLEKIFTDYLDENPGYADDITRMPKEDDQKVNEMFESVLGIGSERMKLLDKHIEQNFKTSDVEQIKTYPNTAMMIRIMQYHTRNSGQ